MISFVFPWLLILLPLPLVLPFLLPAAQQAPNYALRVPFYSDLSDWVASGRKATTWGIKWFAVLIWGLLVIAAARPLWFGHGGQLPASGRDLMMVIDISGSMREMDFSRGDVPVSRLDAVKATANTFIQQRQGDRIGLILFGAQPFLRAPLSYDHVTIRHLINEAEVALAGEYTAIGDAIGLAIKRMYELDSESRVIVLLTDGANNEGTMGPRQAATLAARTGIRIYTIAIGQEDEAVPNPLGPWSSKSAASFERQILQSMADATGGFYFHVEDTSGLERAYAHLDELEPALADAMRQYLATPLYTWFLGLALLLSFLMAMKALMRNYRLGGG